MLLTQDMQDGLARPAGTRRSYKRQGCLSQKRLAADIRTNLYPWLSRGKMTSRVTAPWPLSAEYSLSDCIGKVPVLLSSAPWTSRSGFLILSACRTP